MSIYIAECTLGRGVFARRRFLGGEAILGFGGIVIDADKCKAKGEREGYPLQVLRDAWIDATEPGAFVNHSCEPNAYVGEGNLLIALRNIRVGEQIMYDYSATMYNDAWTMICRCGSPKCRKVIGEFRSLPKELRNYYIQKELVAPYIIRALRREKTISQSLQTVGIRLTF